MSQNMPHGDYILLGYIGKPHGLRGGFFLKTKDRRTDWDGYEHIFLEIPEKGLVQYHVSRHYLSGGALVLCLNNVLTRETVESYENFKIYIHRDQIQLEEDEWSVHELCQYQVLDTEGHFMGKILGVSSFGAQENLEIEVSEEYLKMKNIRFVSKEKKIIYYPFLDSFISQIDSQNKVITIFYISEFLGEKE
jgi:16S rRNA processing protein RimM